MLAQRRYEAARPAIRANRRKRTGVLHRLFHSPMACVLLLAFTVLLVLGIYVSAYAKLTEIGYQKTQLLSDLRALKAENDALRMKLDEFRQPDRIAMFAGENGMEQSAEMAYITPPAQVHLAENSEDLR